MKIRNYKPGQGKKPVLPTISPLGQYQPPGNAAKALFDGVSRMCNDIATKEKEAVIRLYLLRAVTENITLREAVAKYKAEKAFTNEYADGVRSITNREAGGNTLSYECFIRLVPRCSMEAESVEWQDIEREFVDFLEKGIGK